MCSTFLIWLTINSILFMNRSGSWSCSMFMSTRWLRHAKKASLNLSVSMLRRIAASTSARGYMVSRLPRGICKTTE